MSESFSPQFVNARLTSLGGQPGQRYVCAVSGGADSLALAHALGQTDLDVRLVHVNHHLQTDSDQWARQMTEFAAQASADLTILDVYPDADANIEAQAREARYAALAEHLKLGEILLTGHHQEDQALTVLLQLLRGAGPAGLSAMPHKGRCGPHLQWRPLLETSAQTLRNYARDHRLPVIEDPSNADERFARNFLRANVVPLLEARWPAYARTLTRSAAHCAQAQALLGELARVDAAELATPDRGIDLSRDAINSDRRAENVLRFAFHERALRPPPTARLQEFVRQVRNSAEDRQPRLDLPTLSLRAYERHVFFVAPVANTADIDLQLDPMQPLTLPSPAGSLVWQAPLTCSPLRVRFRHGARRYGQFWSSDLKGLMRGHQVLPWLRNSVPLVYESYAVVAIGDLWCHPAHKRTFRWIPETKFTL